MIFISAYLAETLWDALFEREAELAGALEDLHLKNEEMVAWLRGLGNAATLITTGQGTHGGEPLPGEVHRALTQSNDEMAETVNRYFANLLLQDRLSSIGVLASGVAHELNTPLTTMQFIVGRDPAISRETRKALGTEIDRMAGIAKGLLTFASPSALSVLDLNQVVSETLKLLRDYSYSNIEFKTELHSSALPILGMRSELEEVLVNLVNNSIDALAHHPSARIEIKTHLHPGEGDVAQLVVSDNGTGIAPEILSKVLDPFFTTKPPGKGTGLGLYMVHQIVQRHHAKIDIGSTLNSGTRVTLTFALAKQSMPLRKAA